jgi:hypothetical protein
MEKETLFLEEWSETTGINWWNEGRKKLNKIIRKFNKWQRVHDFDPEKSRKLLSRIEEGKQTIGAKDGGSGYLEELEKMESFVNQNINKR